MTDPGITQLDNEDSLKMVSDATDVIVLPSGQNVRPEDLEAHYSKTPLVKELAVVSIRDESRVRDQAERLVAVVVPDFDYLRLSHICNSKEAIRYALDDLGRELSEYQRVRDYIVRIDPLPRTSTLEIERFELKRAIEAGTLKGAAKVWDFTAADREILASASGQAVVSAISQNVKDAAGIHPDMNLEIDLGFDSLARAETFAAVEIKLGVEFSTAEAARALTVGELIELAAKSVPPAVAGGLTRVIGNTRGPQNARPQPAATAAGTDGTWGAILRNTNDEIPELRRALRNRPIFLAFLFTAYKTFNVLCRIFLRLEVTGIENLRRMKRPFLVCPNHQSFLDPFVVCSLYPFDFFKNSFHIGASYLFTGRVMSFVASMLHIVPVDPDTQLTRAMKAGAIGLRRGKILNIYPEGERAYDGRLHEFKKGAAIFATELDLPIIPVAIDGLYKVWPRRSMKIRPAKAKVHFGEPFYARDILSEPGAAATGVLYAYDSRYELITAHLKNTIASMIEEMRK